jgi:hypothetical protein
MKTLWKSHRLIGYEVARVTTADNQDLVILQTEAHRQEVSLAHMLLPVTDKEIVFHTVTELIQVVERARFLGMDTDMLQKAFDAVLREETLFL